MSVEEDQMSLLLTMDPIMVVGGAEVDIMVEAKLWLLKMALIMEAEARLSWWIITEAEEVRQSLSMTTRSIIGLFKTVITGI